jgi:hypothetical protein
MNLDNSDKLITGNDSDVTIVEISPKNIFLKVVSCFIGAFLKRKRLYYSAFLLFLFFGYIGACISATSAILPLEFNNNSIQFIALSLLISILSSLTVYGKIFSSVQIILASFAIGMQCHYVLYNYSYNEIYVIFVLLFIISVFSVLLIALSVECYWYSERAVKGSRYIFFKKAFIRHIFVCFSMLLTMLLLLTALYHILW